MTNQINQADHAIHKIGVISDTHGLLRENVMDILRTCEAVLHGGDIHNRQVLEQLKAAAPFYAVCGNADHTLAPELPKSVSVELFGLKIFMIHNKKQIPADLSGHDLIIYGHSHKYAKTQSGGQVGLNPGSCGARRFSLPVTMAVIHTPGDGTFEIERIDLASPAVKAASIPSDKLKSITERVIKETDKGTSVENIAKKCRIPIELADQICRLYLTHPGIHADGILKKMQAE